MKNLNIALRSLFKKGRSNGIKILSLGVGLAMGLVLISKVCFERSFDKFYPDSDRIYRLHENIIRDGEYKSYGQVSGGVATAMQVEIPEVEKATRLTYIGGDKELFKTQDGNRYSARYVVMGDTNVFDLLPRPILIGDPKETLSRPGYVMISNRIAKLLGGAEQAVNKEFEFESSPGQTYTIGGVFEDVPENSHLRFEIVASLEGMSKWSRENWLGNDRYLGYVKLYPGTDPLGVIRDFQLRDITQENSPVMFRFRNMESGWWPWSYVVEVQGDPVKAYESVRKVFEEVSGVPFEGQFIDQGIRTHFESQIRLAKIVVIFACIAILISLLGLLAMSTYFILQRSQEVAIRKVFGSDNRGILVRLVGTFLTYVGIAFVIATPLSWYFMKQWLADYSYRIALSPLIFIVAGLFCLLISFLAVFFQSWKAANANPVESVKNN